jgi:hypothetical protein
LAKQEPTQTERKDDLASDYEHFEELTRKLVRVPKREVDKARQAESKD